MLRFAAGSDLGTTQETRTRGWGRFAGYVHTHELWIGTVVCTSLVWWVEHWTHGQARRCKEVVCPFCIERAAKRTRYVLAFRRQGERGWRLLEAGKRFAARWEIAMAGEEPYGSIIRLQRDGESANASWLVRRDGRAVWSNLKREPVPLTLIRSLVEPL